MLDRWVLLSAIAALTFLGFVALQYDAPEAFNLIVVGLVALLPGASQITRAPKP
jgi:hypothetical protein